MRGVRFTKAEREWLVETLEQCRGTDKAVRLRDAILGKLESAEMPVAKRGLSPQVAISAFGAVLGDRLIAPPTSAAGVFAAMGKRLAALGLTAQDCRTIAQTAAAAWRGPIKAESLVRQAEILLSGRGPATSSAAHFTPAELRDDEI